MLMETEIWKDIPGYEWYYQVSSLGRVKSLERIVWKISVQRISERILIQTIWNWYNRVFLRKNGVTRTLGVHRLVASAFLWLDLNFISYKLSLCVCHKDDNPINNKVDNLFLWTQKENLLDMYKKWRWTRLKGEYNHLFWRKWELHTSSKQVMQMTKEWVFIKIYCSATYAWIAIWKDPSWISHCCCWRKKQFWWYIWKYV